jgi:rod shape-determining protein MreD
VISEIIKWFGIFILAIVLQTAFVPVVGIYNVQPDLIMIALFVLCTKYGMMPGIYVGFFVGLSQDLYSPGLLGQTALAKTVAGFFMGIFNERFMRTDLIVKIIIMLLAFLLHDGLYIGAEILRAGAPAGETLLWLLTKTLPRSAYTITCVVIFYVWTRFVKQPAFRR